MSKILQFKKKLKNFLIHYLLELRDFYHKLVLTFLWNLKNPTKVSKNWIFISNSTSNIDINAGKMMIVYLLMKFGWHAELMFPRLRNYSLFNHKSLLRNFNVKSRFYCQNVGEKKIKYEDLEIDIISKKIIFKEINYFYLIDSFFSAKFREYKVNYNDEIIKKELNLAIDSLTSTLEICQLIESFINIKKITLILSDTVVIPNGIFILYFDKYFSQNKINIFAFGYSYRTYHNKGNIYGNTYMLNKCNNKYLHYYYANKSEFESWYKNINSKKLVEINKFCSEIFLSNHNKKFFKKDNTNSSLINIAKKNNIPIYCLFGHLSFDRQVYDYTECFEDMLHWIKITIEIFSKNGHMLLIKPHIMEELLINSKKPNKQLSDLVDVNSLPKNIIMLKPNEYLAHEIFEIIDASIIWSSTAYLESVYFDKPAIYCGSFSNYSDVLIEKKITNIETYENMLSELPNIKNEKTYKEKTMSIVYYLNKVCVHKIDIFSELPSYFGWNIIINPIKLFKFIFNNNDFILAKKIINESKNLE